MPTTIYALCEPGNRRVRYVGKTINLKHRFSAHLSQSVKEPNRLGRWLQKLASRNEKPYLRVLCAVPDQCAAVAEILSIRQARNAGAELVNSTDGGDGCVNPTQETREKIRKGKLGAKNPNFGKPCLEATKAATAKSNRLRVRSQEELEKLSESKRGPKNPNFGRPLSPETRAKMSKVRTGKVFSREHCARISAVNKGKTLSIETRSLLRRSKLGFSVGPRYMLKKLPYFLDGGGI